MKAAIHLVHVLAHYDGCVTRCHALTFSQSSSSHIHCQIFADYLNLHMIFPSQPL